MKKIKTRLSSPPVTYVSPFIGRIPKMLNAHTAMITPIAMKWASPRCTTPSLTVQVELGNQRDTTRSPMILPKIASTTDQPIQYPNVAIGPTSVVYLRQASLA